MIASRSAANMIYSACILEAQEVDQSHFGRIARSTVTLHCYAERFGECKGLRGPLRSLLLVARGSPVWKDFLCDVWNGL